MRATKRYLDMQGRYRELVEYGDKLLLIAKEKNDKHTLAWLLYYWLAWVYLTQKDIDCAMKCAKESLSLYEELNDVKGKCFILAGIGRIFREAKKYDEAEKQFDQATNLAKENNLNAGIANALFGLGILARDREEWNKAKEYLQKVVNWCEENIEELDMDIDSHMAALGNLGWVEFHLGNPQKGRDFMERSLMFVGRFGGKLHEGKLHFQLATIEKVLGNREKALQHAQEAHFWAERLGMVRELEGAKALLRELNVSDYQ